jgi:2-hydroxychromene-2-carboxylate isomerase
MLEQVHFSPPIEAERSLPAKSLDFWFDYTCPFAYLGSTQARALAARMGVPLVYRPVLLGGIFRAVDTPQHLFASHGPQRAAHERADMQRWAARFGVELRMPEGHPLRSVEALRATLATGNDPAVIDAFYRVYWTEGRAISSKEVITEVVSKAGHDAADVLQRIASPAIKDELRARTDEGVSLGLFGVPTWIVDGAHLYWGQDRLAFVEGVRPVAPAQSDAAPATSSHPAAEFYWDFSSPFAYLAATQLDALARRTGRRIDAVPILLGGLFRAIGTPDVPLATFSEAKQRHTMNDLHRWAAYWGVPFRFPSRFPTKSLRALRVYLALPEAHRARYRNAVFRACWVEDRDIASDPVIAECIGDDLLARDAFLRADSDDVKGSLRASTERAVARGVFGVPTFVVNDDLYWGQDRLELVERALRQA